MTYAFGLLALTIAFSLGFVVGALRFQETTQQLARSMAVIRGYQDDIEALQSDREGLEASLASARAERDDSWDYANRLLESPQYYADQVGTIRAVAAAPLYGAFGRLPETEA